MENSEFKEILAKAVQGDKDALEKIILLYMPLINGYSIVDSRIDEDLRQHIMMRITMKIRNFKI